MTAETKPAPTTDTLTFDLVALQTMNGAIVGTLRHGLHSGEALQALVTARIEGELGAGVVPMLIPTTDPLYQVRNELERARGKHAPYNSAHEAYAVMLEEVEEFWTEVKAQAPSSGRMRAELIQIAATAIRAVEDLEL